MIYLRNFDGREIAINVDHIVSIHPMGGSYGTQGIIKTVDGHRHEVRESVDEIKRLIESRTK